MKTENLLKIPVILTAVLILTKFIIYLSTKSVAIFSLFADSFFDLIGSGVSLLVYKYFKIDKEDKYQYGFYGIMDISTLIISTLIISTTVFIYYESIINLCNKKLPNYDIFSIVIMLLSTFISFILVFILKGVYSETKLLLIKSEVNHYFADGFTNLGVLLSILICKFVYNSYFIDPIIAMIMGYCVARPAFIVLKDLINNIVFKRIDESIKNNIINLITSDKNILDYSNLKIRKSGERFFIQANIKINKNLTFEEVHDIVVLIENRIEENIENSEVILHACPYNK